MSQKQTTPEQDDEETTEYAEEKHETVEKIDKKGKALIDSTTPRRKVCPDYFGVKSYLHNFYDESTFKDPSIYEDEDDFRYLLNPNARRRRCPPIWLKICVWLSVNLLFFGAAGILVGYLVPSKVVIHQVEGGDDLAYIDKGALRFNTVLDLFKLVGLILFCVGGILLASALMFPSFMSHCCTEEPTDEAIRVKVRDEKPPLSPIEMTIPATSKVKSVQPGTTKHVKLPPHPEVDTEVQD
ncbi:hypothetical protein FSP39_017998 [Pinctada imbricata]|uniref:Neurensin-1 n=1 Tax=Pinctada imbricata TaxID=66713 RepID=A0AA88XT29_PINIB|nr:hypothetical protein FSP39_017998 [Pinctada imbricata]